MASGIRDDLPGRPYLDTFVFRDGSTIMGQTEFTAVVIDPDEFDRLMEDLKTKPPSNTSASAWEEAVAKMKWLRNIPAIGRGDKTAWIFDRYGVQTKIMGVMVRGESQNVIKKMRLTTNH